MTIDQLKISGIEKEIHFQFARSGGKGGQHVNKTESKAELYFDIGESEVLSLSEKELLRAKQKNRINNEDTLVLSDETSALTDSFQDNLLSGPIYTRPADYKGWKVPEVLTSGHFAKIDKWREDMAYEHTKNRRPDLLEGY